MIAFEGQLVTSLDQPAAEEPGDGLRALLRDSRKKQAEVQRTAKAVNITSSRLTGQ